MIVIIYGVCIIQRHWHFLPFSQLTDPLIKQLHVMSELVQKDIFDTIRYLVENHGDSIPNIDALLTNEGRSELRKLTLLYHPDKGSNKKSMCQSILALAQWWDEVVKGLSETSETHAMIKREYYMHQNNTFTHVINSEKRARNLKETIRKMPLTQKDMYTYDKICKKIKNIERKHTDLMKVIQPYSTVADYLKDHPEDSVKYSEFVKFPKLLEHPVTWNPEAKVRIENYKKVRKNYLFYFEMGKAEFTLDECIKYIVLFAEKDLKVGTKTKYTQYMWFLNMLGAERVNKISRRLYWD